MGKSFILSVLFACALGIAIAWVDSRPNWDDAGISAFLVLFVSMVAGYIAKQKPWLIALAVSAWIPLYGILSAQNFGSLLALVPGFIGAYVGWLTERIITEK